MTKDLTKGSPARLIIYFAIPLLIGNVFQQLYSMVDAVIVGRYVSEEALAAVGVTGAIFFLVIGFVQGVTSGFSIVTAQRFGAGDEAGVRKSVGISIWLSVILTVILTVISVATARPLLNLMNTPDNIIEDAVLYITIIYAGIFASMYYNLVSGIIRALGDSKTPLYFLILSAVFNVVLDLFFIIKLHLGVAGAGYATVLSQLLSAVFCTFYMAKRYDILRLTKEDMRFDREDARIHLSIGIPMALQFSVTAIGVMVMQAALNRFGSTAIASFTAAVKVEQLVNQPMNALGITMATYCGQNLGAGRMDRIRKGMRSCMKILVLMVLFAAFVSIFGGRAITGLFVKNPTEAIYHYAGQYLNTISVFYPALGLLLVFRSALQGMGEALYPMLGGVLELVSRLVVSLTLPAFFGYTGICLASPIAWTTAIIPLIIRYLILMKGEKNGREYAGSEGA